MPTDRLTDYVAEIMSMKKRAKPQTALQIRLGLEVDWHAPEIAPGQAARLRDLLEMYPFDYIIGSVHEVQTDHGPSMIDGSPSAWEKLTADQINDMHRRYWRTMKTLAESGVYDIVAHMDLPKKFAFHATADLSKEIHAALDALAAARTPTGGPLVVEVNTAGWHKPCADAYPTLDILRECRRRDIPATINADAHHAEHLLRDFDKAALRLKEAGYAQIARFADRTVRFEPLANALEPLAA
jgi:histidinol-phosphatase (PHP family)